MIVTTALGLLFIYSGYAKLLPVIETFEFTFVDSGVTGWSGAPILARLVVAMELALGSLLIARYRLRAVTLPAAASLLALFTVYLAVQLWQNGDSGNCGCFGERLHMTPLQAIYKNLAMLAGCGIAFALSRGWKLPRLNWLFLSLIVATSVALPFIVNPVDYSYTSNNLDEKVGYPLDLDLLYHPADTSKVEVPRVDLRRGRHVVAFMSLTCPHCRIAAKKFRIIKKNNPTLPVYFILNGDRDRYEPFIEDTRASNIPSSFCLGKSFVQLSGTVLPRIYYLENGTVVKKVDYFELSQYDIESWLEAPPATDQKK